MVRLGARLPRRNGHQMDLSMKHLSLCTGIGGLDLAAEWAGFETVAQCEIDEYASRVLAKNFRGVPNLHDIQTVTNERLAEFGIDRREITVISAGFPCQPYSLAGKGRGDRDERDLWSEVARVVGEIRPKWFVGENTPGLFARSNQRYFRRVLDDLAALGYSVGWGIWGACDVGAAHKRDRVFIMAHADGENHGGGQVFQENFPTPTVADSKNVGFNGSHQFNLHKYVALFPTPQATSWGCSGARERLKRLETEGEITEMERKAMSAGNGGKLNPTWVEWLMGFPLGWTGCDASGTQ